MPKEKKEMTVGLDPNSCAACKQLKQKNTHYRGSVLCGFVCDADGHELNGDLDKRDTDCPLDKKDEDN